MDLRTVWSITWKIVLGIFAALGALRTGYDFYVKITAPSSDVQLWVTQDRRTMELPPAFRDHRRQAHERFDDLLTTGTLDRKNKGDAQIIRELDERHRRIMDELKTLHDEAHEALSLASRYNRFVALDVVNRGTIRVEEATLIVPDGDGLAQITRTAGSDTSAQEFESVIDLDTLASGEEIQLQLWLTGGSRVISDLVLDYKGDSAKALVSDRYLVEAASGPLDGGRNWLRELYPYAALAIFLILVVAVCYQAWARRQDNKSLRERLDGLKEILSNQG